MTTLNAYASERFSFEGEGAGEMSSETETELDLVAMWEGMSGKWQAMFEDDFEEFAECWRTE